MDARLVLGVKKTYASGLTSPFALDTTWLGHSYTNHWSPTQNWWNLHTGEVLMTGTPNPANAVWDWDHATGLPGNDSLAGWWPVRRAYDLTGGYTIGDDGRAWWALDYGNQVNYVINQGVGAKRTTGVVGVWHSDPGSAAGGVSWAPISGVRSAWCGLRRHGDLAVVDPITGNPFNQSTMEFNGPSRPSWRGGTASGFPGYASQWDQLLYRDLQPPAGQSLELSFKYRTRMSSGADRAAATRTGWFHGDPLAVTSGNFISSTGAGADAPVDSFMVYIGAPVSTGACLYSDGIVRPVHDPARRWFSEVLRIFEPGSAPYYELFSTSGDNPADTLAATPTVTLTVPAFQVDAIRQAPGNTGIVRLVFRVKTNRGYDDETSATAAGVAYTSHGRGAALIDDVVVNAVTIGSFEPGDGQPIDNSPGVSPLLAWKSTGKPPAVYFHPHNLADLEYSDVCGPPDSPYGLCDMTGNVIAAGNHDAGEILGGATTPERELMIGMVSPTINLVTSGPPNAMGITPEILDATDDWYIRYDIYTGIFDRLFTGCTWTVGFQSFPATQWNGTKCWGPIRVPEFQMYNPAPACLYDVENGFSNGLIVSSNANGIPDSLRLFIGVTQQCFRFGVTLGCGSDDGGYFDNVALGFVDVGATTSIGDTPARQAMSLLNDQWFSDAFPFNRTADPSIPAQFDTTSALIKPDLNIAPCTGNTNRAYVLGDSGVVTAPGDDGRVDLVFRLRPGPGSFVVAGQSGSGLRQVPASPAAATPGDGSFWGQYLASHDGGSGFGTPGGHGGQWNPLVWNSARCDTAERNLFPIAARGNLAEITPGLWMSTYHESDPKFTTIGAPRFRCFVVDTSGAAQSGNVVCDGTVPAWLTTVPQSRTGYDGVPTTREFIKILPDGVFTPGTNIQYFYRKSRLSDPATAFTAPDTNVAWPQRSEGQNFDLHRFATVSILPDQWSVAAYDTAAEVTHGGGIVFTTDGKRFGFEFMTWVTGMASERWNLGGVEVTGQGVGYGKAGFGLYFGNPDGVNYGLLLSAGMELKAKTPIIQVGWGTELEICKRPFGNIQLTTGTYTNTQVGPTLQMLQRYALMIQDPGAAVDGLVQPYRDNPLLGLQLLNSYVFGLPGFDHALWLMGRFPRWIDRIKQVETPLGAFESIMKATLRSTGIGSLSGSLPGLGDSYGLRFSSSPDFRGLWEPLGDQDDVLDLLPGPGPQDATTSSSAVAAAFYDASGPNGPYIASVYTPWSPEYRCITLVDAFSLDKVVDRTGSGNSEMAPYAHRVLGELFAPAGPFVPAVVTGVEPPGAAPVRATARVLGNPATWNEMTIRLSVPSAAPVEATLFDITGRRVHVLANTVYPAGEHDLRWDRRADDGKPVAPGVYLLRIRIGERSFLSREKVVVLR